jgi:hypothetical protein
MAAFLLRGAIGFEEFFFVKNGIGDDVFSRGPGAQIEQAATLRTEWEIRMLGGVRGLFADGAAVFHVEERVLPQTARMRTV